MSYLRAETKKVQIKQLAMKTQRRETTVGTAVKIMTDLGCGKQGL